jgi:diguanylate cyclase (GGDEF)-like protein
MPVDLFTDEQQILDHALDLIKQVRGGAPFDIEEYAGLANEYKRLLKQLRRTTKFADRTAEELHETNIDLQTKVMFDPLTGLYNRRYMDETLNRNIIAISRSKGMISVLMVDIDHFKNYNDTYGHAAGDTCLASVAEALGRCVYRAGDYVVRYGGEEFAIILPHTDEHGACNIARQALNVIRSLNIPHEQSETAEYLTISVGVTTVFPDHTHKGRNYTKRADEALYLSKKAGRNRYTFLKYK